MKYKTKKETSKLFLFILWMRLLRVAQQDGEVFVLLIEALAQHNKELCLQRRDSRRLVNVLKRFLNAKVRDPHRNQLALLFKEASGEAVRAQGLVI